jgi:peptidyl-Lys metalloendopeptidase
MKPSRLGLSILFAATLAAFFTTEAATADQLQHKKACSASQQSAAQKALTDARTALTKALGTVKDPTPADLDRLQKWFGPLASNTAAQLQKEYAAALTHASFSQFWCPVSNDLDFKWNGGDLAAVHPDAPGAIFLTPDFFKLSTTGADSQIGTFIHELTHLAGIGLKPEEVYGTQKARQLALSDPARARRNSDNFQYYIEDLVFKLP